MLLVSKRHNKQSRFQPSILLHTDKHQILLLYHNSSVDCETKSLNAMQQKTSVPLHQQWQKLDSHRY